MTRTASVSGLRPADGKATRRTPWTGTTRSTPRYGGRAGLITANRYLEAIGSPERLDLRSYARQGIDKIPTVHMGPAVSQLEKKGIQTNIGNLNRDIKAANSLMQSIRQMVRSLKGWLSGLKEKKAALLEALEQAKEPTIPELLSGIWICGARNAPAGLPRGS